MRKVCIILIIIIKYHGFALSQDPTFISEGKISMSLSDYKVKTYNITGAMSEADIRNKVLSKQPISSEVEAYSFLGKIIPSLAAPLSSLMEYTKDESKALILLLHPVDLSKFEMDEKKLTLRKSLEDEFKKLGESKNDNDATIEELKALASTYLAKLKDAAVSLKNMQMSGRNMLV